MLDTLWQDLRYATRSLLRTRGFTATVLLTLGIGIGGTTAIYSVVDAVVLRPLGYQDADRLYVVHEVLPAPGRPTPEIPVNALHFEEWRASARTFDEVSLISPVTFELTGAGEPLRVPGARVSPSLFPMLGLQVQYGRLFTPDEARSGNEGSVVLGNGLWKSHFGADPNVIGRTIRLGGMPAVVVGVLQAGAELPKLTHLYAMTFVSDGRPELWMPFVARRGELNPTGAFNFAAIARLKTGVSRTEALSELNTIQEQLGRRMPGSPLLRASLVPLREQITGRSRRGLQLLLGTVALVLLVGCVNVANLLLTRGAARSREFAIRQAAGAGRLRLVRQLFVESLILAVAGGLLGVVIAQIAIRAIVAAAPLDVPFLDEVALDGRVLLFTLGVSLGSGVLVGLIPAWRLSRAAPFDTLRVASTTLARGRGGARPALVSLEVGASTACVIVAGLLASSFATLLRVDRGFDTDRIVGATVFLPQTRYDDARATRLLDALKAAARSWPSVTSVGVSDRLPLSGEGGNSALMVEGTTLPRFQRPITAAHLADGDYFKTMGIPLLAGRLIDETDRQRTTVAVVSAATAERVWPGESPIGKRFRYGPDDSPLIEVVGVVGNIRGVSLDSAPRLDVYLPYWSRYVGQASLSLSTTASPQALTPAFRAAVARLDPELAIPTLQTMRELEAESVAPWRFQMDLALLFAATALLLAGVGIYGTVAHAVGRRTNEIGVRMALGAQPRRIRTMVLVQGLTPVAIGIAAGVGVALAFAGTLRSLLYGVSPADTTTLVAAGVVLGCVGLLASYFPARRATRVNPIEALRAE